MKIGKTLQEMAVELERQKGAKRDFIALTTELEMMDDNTGREKPTTVLRVNSHGSYPINDIGHEQIASRVGIPKTYYDRMRSEAPALMAHNVNAWFHKQPEKRMVRTMDGNVRAFLSDRFRPLDNFDLADVAFNTLIKAGVRVESTELTERRLYIKAVTERVSAKVLGDVVQATITISNSEVGCGSVKIEPGAFKLGCLNGMVFADYSMKKYHVGRSGSEGEFAQEFFKNKTRQADDHALWMKVRDVIEGSFKQDLFNGMVEKIRLSSQKVITGDIPKVIELVQDKFGLTDDEKGGILRHLIKGYDLSQWGLINAITRTAQDVPDYDRSTDLERLGGQVLELPKIQWQEIAEAA